MLDELRQIAIFAKAVDHGSFRAAATELRLSPSVISHHVSQLEEKLGVALIYRSTRRLTLTRDGERLLASAHEMLSAVEAGLDDIRGQSVTPSGRLRITLPSLLSQSRLIEMLVSFRARYPKVHIELNFSDERFNLIEKGYDLAIRMSPNRKRAPNRQVLFTTNRSLIASRQYLSDIDPILHPHDLNSTNWIELIPVQSVKTVLRKQGESDILVQPGNRLAVNDAFALYRLAQAGAGIALVPDFLAAADIAAARMVVVLPDWQVDRLEAYVEWPSNSPKGGLARLLVSELALACKEQSLCTGTDPR